MSRVQIDTYNRQKMYDLTHAGAYHSWVEDSFPDERKRKERSRKLWRIDNLNGNSYLLLISEKKPDLTRLEKYGVHGTGESKSYDKFLSNIQNGNIYQFRAELNPAHKAIDGGRKHVYPEITADQQMNYFYKKAADNGFRILGCDIKERGFKILRKKSQQSVRLCYAVYEGRLEVTDKDRFRNALINGIGREKAYGCGLMTIIPVRS